MDKNLTKSNSQNSLLGVPKFTRHKELFPWLYQTDIEKKKIKQLYPNMSDDLID